MIAFAASFYLLENQEWKLNFATNKKINRNYRNNKPSGEDDLINILGGRIRRLFPLNQQWCTLLTA